MKPVVPAVAAAASLVDALVAAGARRWVLSPGSRSAPFALVLADREKAEELDLHVLVDERDAGYFAVGLLRGQVDPVAVVCTSGTAAVNLHPAMVEASHSGLPLIAITADRPAELQGVASSQTIDQVGVFAPAVTTTQVSAPTPADHDWSAILQLPIRAPVHLNCQFRPPLVGPVPTPQPQVTPTELPDTDSKEQPSRAALPTADGAIIVGDLAGAPSGIREGVLALAREKRWPVLAEPTAGLAASEQVFPFGPLLLRRLQPDFVLTVGRFGLDRTTAQLVADKLHWSIQVTAETDPPDPYATAAQVLTQLPAAGEPSALGWLAHGRGQVAIVEQVIGQELGGGSSEANLVRAVTQATPGPLFVAASWPLRMLWNYCLPRSSVAANRGVNGIDGLIATAAGYATARQESTVGLLGDLAFLHDVGALGADVVRAAPLTLVVLDNNGGGIFSQLEQADPAYSADFERVFGTPHNLDLVRLVAGFGVPVVAVADPVSLQREVQSGEGSLRVVVARAIPREREAELHRRIAARLEATNE